jgi:hypothetical protein
MEERIGVLAYAVRGRVVLKYCGQLGLMLAVLTLVPPDFSVVEKDWAFVYRLVVLCGGIICRA